MAEEKEKDTRQGFQILYEKCLTCNYLVPFADEIFKCSDDPECPGQAFIINVGRRPEAIAEKLSDWMLEGEVAEKKLNKFLKKLQKRSDAISIIKMASEKYEEKKKQKELSEVPV